MSLDNVFMGKRVVQQIYLKNALIYQSKGWETLPSAPQVEWTKNFGSIGSFPTDCAMDQDNNIYIAVQSFVYKISADGLLLWRKAFSGAQKICIDQDNNIYLAQLAYLNQTDTDQSLIINHLDTSGNVINKIKVNAYISDDITGFTFDKTYLYISSRKSSVNNSIYKVDKKLINSDFFNPGFLISFNVNNLATTETCPNIYFTNGNSLYQMKKGTSTFLIATQIGSNNTIDSSILDNLGNVILSSSEGIFKYNIDTKQQTKIMNMGTASYNFSLRCIDYQQNLYGISFSNTPNNKVLTDLFKISSDNTLIYNSRIINDSNATSGRLTVDNNGNIYYVYRNFNYELLITKIINLVKKGN